MPAVQNGPPLTDVTLRKALPEYILLEVVVSTDPEELIRAITLETVEELTVAVPVPVAYPPYER